VTELRTFRRADLDEANQRWQAGRFSDEWKPFRHEAAMRGFIFPPDGDRFDSWEDEQPSQRAVLVRAIRETPRLLAACIDRSRSWGEVIARLIPAIEGFRDEAWRQTRQLERDRDQPGPRESTVAIKRILDRIGAS